MQFQILDRLSFMRFLNLNLHNNVPDEKTIWKFREDLTNSGKIETLFERFRNFLLKQGIIAQSGSIVDASFVDAPKQRNNKEENKLIKDNTPPEDWPENKRRQKDVDARWASKNKKTHYGYKNHVKVDRKSKIIMKYEVTNASVHDSQVIESLLEKRDCHHDLFADSAYSSATIKALLKKMNIRNRINEKGVRNHPLTELQKAKNKKKSKIRCRIEHIFGYIVLVQRESKIFNLKRSY